MEYCGKPESRVEGPWEEGQPGEQGKRNDLNELAVAVKRGDSMREIATDYAAEFIKYHKGIAALRFELDAPRRRDNLRVYLLVGNTGTGKSRFIHKFFPDCYTVSCTRTPWFDGYRGERVGLLEECGPDMMSVNWLKRILDIYPIRVPVKGGMVSWNPEIIFLTSNHELVRWYDNGRVTAADQAALGRRITVVEFGGATDWGSEAFISLNERKLALILRRDGLDIGITEEEASGAPTTAVRESGIETETRSEGPPRSVLSPTRGALLRQSALGRHDESDTEIEEVEEIINGQAPTRMMTSMGPITEVD